MPRDRLLFILATLVCLIVVMHLAATALHLYWTIWWYDIIVHFLGGAFAGLLILWLRFFSGYFGSPLIPSKMQLLCFVALATLAVGVGWEVFERVLGHTWSVEGYWLDTILDVILDLLGSIIAFLFFRSRYMVHGQEV